MMIHDIFFRELVAADLDGLLFYLHHLSNETKSRFGPHAFDKDAVITFYNDDELKGYVAEDKTSNTIIAYAIIKKGILFHDNNRLSGYNYSGIEKDSCTYAPSVADEWQGKGIGKLMFAYIQDNCKNDGIKKIILWGGVQCKNERAVNFYKKVGFVTLGIFEYNGFNQDMLLEIA